jgi:phosphoribosylformimino-5-aminoimidazole carboxamide ribotide isomerase
MIVYPAIDLIDGQCVRLAQGRFEDATIYSADPAAALAGFASAGAEWAHIVDLDGAKAGAPVQHGLLAGLAAGTSLKLQVAGGVRSREHVAALLDAGVERVTIGSLAVKDPEAVRSMLSEFGADRITIALDVNIVGGEAMVATHGWTQSSRQSLWDAAAGIPETRHLLVTDIGRDGMMSGPNVELLTEVVRRLPDLAVQASGGVSSIEDLESLTTHGVIIGKALWEGRIDLAEAIHACA